MRSCCRTARSRIRIPRTTPAATARGSDRSWQSSSCSRGRCTLISPASRRARTIPAHRGGRRHVRAGRRAAHSRLHLADRASRGLRRQRARADRGRASRRRGRSAARARARDRLQYGLRARQPDLGLLRLRGALRRRLPRTALGGRQARQRRLVQPRRGAPHRRRRGPHAAHRQHRRLLQRGEGAGRRGAARDARAGRAAGLQPRRAAAPRRRHGRGLAQHPEADRQGLDRQDHRPAPRPRHRGDHRGGERGRDRRDGEGDGRRGLGRVGALARRRGPARRQLPQRRLQLRRPRGDVRHLPRRHDRAGQGTPRGDRARPATRSSRRAGAAPG